MTKKQVLSSLREVLSQYRYNYDLKCSRTATTSEFDYYKGQVDAVDYVLETLCFYD